MKKKKLYYNMTGRVVTAYFKPALVLNLRDKFEPKTQEDFHLIPSSFSLIVRSLHFHVRIYEPLFERVSLLLEKRLSSENSRG